MPPAIFIASLVVLAVWTLQFRKSLRSRNGLHVLDPGRPGASVDQPACSILVPARNEEEIIGSSVGSLINQELKDFELIVLNDNSTDRTGEILDQLARENSGKPRVIHGREDPPAGWFGKPWALQRLGEAARRESEWLLFTDADCIHHPRSVALALDFAAEHGADMVSLFPFNQCDTFTERLFQPSIAALTGLRHDPSSVNGRPRDPETAFANGQFILVRRSVWLAMEGWEPVRGKILEDVAWARALRRRGFATMIADGRLVMRTRMYKSLREIIEGWTKNMFQLLGESVPRSLMTVALVSTLPWIPLAALVFGILAWLGGGSAAWLLYALAQYGLVLYFTARLRAIGPGYPAYAPLAPIANLVTAWIVLRSTWRHVRKTGVSWKGRTYVEEP